MRKHLFTAIYILCILSPISIYSQDFDYSDLWDHLKDFEKIRDFTLSQNKQEAYFTIQSPLEEISVITCVQKKDGVWQEPGIASFSGKYKDLEPFISPDQKRLYFVSNRPLDESSEETKDFDIWYVERAHVDAPWSIPVNLGSPVNTKVDEFYPSVAKNGNLYFTSVREGRDGKDDIYFAEWQGVKYSEAMLLGEEINTSGYEFNSFIAPDESFLIFSCYNREDGLGSGDLYISYREMDGKWSKAINLGESINSPYMDYCPFVDLESQTLFFTSRRSVIETKEFHSINELRDYINQYENGQSRIYQAAFNPVKK